MIQIAVILVALAALLGGVTAILHGVKADGRNECKAEYTEAARMASLQARERGDTAAGKYEAIRAQRQERERQATQTIERIVERPVYRDRCIDDDGLRLLGDRIAERPSASEPAGSMPKAADPK